MKTNLMYLAVLLALLVAVPSLGLAQGYQEVPNGYVSGVAAQPMDLDTPVRVVVIYTGPNVQYMGDVKSAVEDSVTTAGGTVDDCQNAVILEALISQFTVQRTSGVGVGIKQVGLNQITIKIAIKGFLRLRVRGQLLPGCSTPFVGTSTGKSVAVSANVKALKSDGHHRGGGYGGGIYTAPAGQLGYNPANVAYSGAGGPGPYAPPPGQAGYNPANVAFSSAGGYSQPQFAQPYFGGNGGGQAYNGQAYAAPAGQAGYDPSNVSYSSTGGYAQPQFGGYPQTYPNQPYYAGNGMQVGGGNVVIQRDKAPDVYEAILAASDAAVSRLTGVKVVREPVK